MKWQVVYHPDFAAELQLLTADVFDALLATVEVLTILGPQLGRPRADTLSGSHFANMKELRFDADGGVWRVAYAFDPVRNAIILVAGDKSGVGQKRFYKTLIAQADKRFAEHLERLKGNFDDS